MSSFKAREKYIPLRYCRFRIWRSERPVRLPIPRCSLIYTRAEEKETDVAIASRMFELLHLNEADAIVLISGDTDLLPAIRTARSLFPASRIAVVFPYNRHNAELKRAVTHSFKIAKDQYSKHQLPDPIALPNGHTIRKRNGRTPASLDRRSRGISGSGLFGLRVRSPILPWPRIVPGVTIGAVDG